MQLAQTHLTSEDASRVELSRVPALEMGARMITVLIVDDHTYIRQGIAGLLEATKDIRVAATAANGIEAVAKASLHQPDVAIVDISMPFMGGIEATRQIRAASPPTRVLALSIYDHKEYIRDALDAGATGYVLKDALPNEILDAIRCLHGGQRYFSRRIAGSILPHLEENNDNQAGQNQKA
jgi:DNA-binding NarL/FixJ family response regulator